MGRTFQLILTVEYFIIMIAYLWSKDFARALYFLGAIILTVGVLLMK